MKCPRSLLALCLTLAAASCERFDVAQEGPPTGSPPDEPMMVSSGPEVAKASIYDLPVELTDQDGKKIGLDAFRGHPVVISMFYASCGYACPTLIADIKRLESALAPEARDDLRVLLVTLDTERDTAERLKRLATERKLDEKRWRLARASEDQVRELAAALGLKYRALDGGEFNHSSVITLLDRKGHVVDTVEGLSQPLEAMVSRTQALSKQR